MPRSCTVRPSRIRCRASGPFGKFRIRAKKVGRFPLTVDARGSKTSDAIKRSIEVLPDGTAVEQVHSDRLRASVKHNITMPPTAIDGASRLFVKIYPGVHSQLVEGVDEEVVRRAPQSGLEEARGKAPSEILDRKASDVLRSYVPGRRVEDIGLEAQLLRAAGVTKVAVCGVATRLVVEAAVFELTDRGFEVYLVEDCCASARADLHDQSVEILRGFAAVAKAQDMGSQFTSAR